MNDRSIGIGLLGGILLLLCLTPALYLVLPGLIIPDWPAFPLVLALLGFAASPMVLLGTGALSAWAISSRPVVGAMRAGFLAGLISLIALGLPASGFFGTRYIFMASVAGDMPRTFEQLLTFVAVRAVVQISLWTCGTIIGWLFVSVALSGAGGWLIGGSQAATGRPRIERPVWLPVWGVGLTVLVWPTISSIGGATDFRAALPSMSTGEIVLALTAPSLILFVLPRVCAGPWPETRCCCWKRDMPLVQPCV